MQLKRTAALVLHCFDHGESDKVVTFYCPTLGKLSGIAKGAKRSKKRFVNKLELFSWLELQYDDRGNGSLVRLAEAELLDSFAALRQNYERYVAAGLLCELMVLWTRENDADSRLFSLLLWAFHVLDAGHQPLHILVLFHAKFFSMVGYEPHLAGCMACGVFDATGQPYGFNLFKGGLFCRRCQPGQSADLIPLALSTAKLLRNAQLLPQDKMARLRFSTTGLCEARNLLRRYGQHLLQREVHSWRFVV